MVNYDKDYLSPVGFDEEAILFGQVRIPDEVMLERFKALRRIGASKLHPDPAVVRSEVVRKRLEALLSDINTLVNEVGTLEKWREYKRGRRAWLQQHGQVNRRDGRYQERIRVLESMVDSLDKEVGNAQRAASEAETIGYGARDQVEGLRNKAEEASKRADEAESRLEASRGARARLEQELEPLRTALDSAEGMITDANRRTAEAEARAARSPVNIPLDPDGEVDVQELVIQLAKLNNEHYAEVQANLRAGNTDKANAILERHFQAYDTSREQTIISLYQDALGVTESNPVEARAKFRRIQELDERNYAAILGEAKAALAEKDFESVRDIAERLTQLDDNLAEAHYLFAIGLSKSERGIENPTWTGWELYRARELGGDDYEGKTQVARREFSTRLYDEVKMRISQGRNDEAFILAEKTVEFAKDSAEAHYLLALALTGVQAGQENPEWVGWHCHEAERLGGEDYKTKTTPIRDTAGQH